MPTPSAPCAALFLLLRSSTLRFPPPSWLALFCCLLPLLLPPNDAACGRRNATHAPTHDCQAGKGTVLHPVVEALKNAVLEGHGWSEDQLAELQGEYSTAYAHRSTHPTHMRKQYHRDQPLVWVAASAADDERYMCAEDRQDAGIFEYVYVLHQLKRGRRSWCNPFGDRPPLPPRPLPPGLFGGCCLFGTTLTFMLTCVHC